MTEGADASEPKEGGEPSSSSSATTAPAATANHASPFIPDFSLLLDSEAFISAISKPGPLRDQLLAIHKSTLKSSFDEQNRRLMQQQQGSFRGGSFNRGRGGKRGGYPTKWTPERGAGRGLKMLANMRTGGLNENAEIEEFAQETIRLLKMNEEEGDNGHA